MNAPSSVGDAGVKGIAHLQTQLSRVDALSPAQQSFEWVLAGTHEPVQLRTHGGNTRRSGVLISRDVWKTFGRRRVLQGVSV